MSKPHIPHNVKCTHRLRWSQALTLVHQIIHLHHSVRQVLTDVCYQHDVVHPHQDMISWGTEGNIPGRGTLLKVPKNVCETTREPQTPLTDRPSCTSPQPVRLASIMTTFLDKTGPIGTPHIRKDRIHQRRNVLAHSRWLAPSMRHDGQYPAHMRSPKTGMWRWPRWTTWMVDQSIKDTIWTEQIGLGESDWGIPWRLLSIPLRDTL